MSEYFVFDLEKVYLELQKPLINMTLRTIYQKVKLNYPINQFIL